MDKLWSEKAFEENFITPRLEQKWSNGKLKLIGKQGTDGEHK